MNLNIYLIFNGNCEEAINFYSKAFETPVDFIQRYGDAPPGAAGEEGHNDKIMHARMNINGVSLMASDGMGQHQATVGDNVSISVNCNSEEEAEKGFNAISEGGTMGMPMAATFWAVRFGMCTDKFGIHWMFNYDGPRG